jgi:hypothetical protein
MTKFEGLAHSWLRLADELERTQALLERFTSPLCLDLAGTSSDFFRTEQVGSCSCALCLLDDFRSPSTNS